LKAGLIGNWNASCKNKITDTGAIALEGDLLDYLNKFNFRIFKYKTVIDLVKGHAGTIFHNRRFGPANFPDRPPIETPPAAIQAKESRYVQQLFETYSEKLSKRGDTSVADRYEEWEGSAIAAYLSPHNL
jgi:hypothetical protein